MRMRVVAVWMGAVISILASPGWALEFNEIARFNIDATAADNMLPEYIGSNPSSVAWSGSRLFVGGFNNSGSFAERLGIVEVLSATATGIVDLPSFAVVASYPATPTPPGVPNGSAYLGMDISADGASLAVNFDDTLPGTPEGFSIINTSDYSQRWAVNVRATSGSAFDPGFNGSDSGTATGAFGSGRRLLYDTTTGSEIYGLATGMIWTDGNGGTLVRDMDFDPLTGDIYVRHNNNLSKATRTGGNSLTPNGIISSVPQADFVNQQNLSFLSQVDDSGTVEDFVIFNDRQNAAALQAFADVIQVIDTAGGAVSANFTFLNGDLPGTGVGAYDFDFDPVTKTLAISDFANRNVHIFQVGTVTSAVNGDFDNNGLWNCLDIDALISAIASGSTDLSFDMNGDSVITLADVNDPTVGWLAVGGSNNPAQTTGNPFLSGDANLDGSVDVSDFNIWNGNKFQSVPAWCAGDFNADGSVDVSDFNIWNGGKFQSSAGGGIVPEPAGLLALALGGLALLQRRRKDR